MYQLVSTAVAGGRGWDEGFIVLVPEHCLSFYFEFYIMPREADYATRLEFRKRPWTGTSFTSAKHELCAACQILSCSQQAHDVEMTSMQNHHVDIIRHMRQGLRS